MATGRAGTRLPLLGRCFGMDRGTVGGGAGVRSARWDACDLLGSLAHNRVSLPGRRS